MALSMFISANTCPIAGLVLTEGILTYCGLPTSQTG